MALRPSRPGTPTDMFSLFGHPLTPTPRLRHPPREPEWNILVCVRVCKIPCTDASNHSLLCWEAIRSTGGSAALIFKCLTETFPLRVLPPSSPPPRRNSRPIWVSQELVSRSLTHCPWLRHTRPWPGSELSQGLSCASIPCHPGVPTARLAPRSSRGTAVSTRC